MIEADTREDTLTQEERLKAVAYQLMSLYDRLSEERLAFLNQQADMKTLVTQLTEQIKTLEAERKHLEVRVRESVHTATHIAAEKIAEKVTQESTRTTANLITKLEETVRTAQVRFTTYEREITMGQWKGLLMTIGTAIATSLLLVWLLLPKPTLPLSDAQITNLYQGQLVNIVWPKLSMKEQKYFIQAVKKNFGTHTIRK